MSNSSEPSARFVVEPGLGGRALVLDGFVGVCEARHLRNAALRALGTSGDVHVKCEGIEYLDVAGMQVLLALAAALAARGNALRLDDARPALTQAVECAGLAGVLLARVEA